MNINYLYYINDNYHKLVMVCVGRGGSLVESIPVDRRVVGSNRALVAT